MQKDLEVYFHQEHSCVFTLKHLIIFEQILLEWWIYRHERIALSLSIRSFSAFA